MARVIVNGTVVGKSCNVVYYSAMSYNLQHDVIEHGDGFEINSEAFAFSRGLLPGVEQASTAQE